MFRFQLKVTDVGDEVMVHMKQYRRWIQRMEYTVIKENLFHKDKETEDKMFWSSWSIA
jgi:hypothetical protein